MYQFVKMLMLPPASIWFLLTALVLLMWWKKAADRRWLLCLTAIVILFYAGSTRIVTRLIVGSLEWSYPREPSLPDQADAILVLGGGSRNYGPDGRPSYTPSESSIMRLMHAARVYHHVGGCPIIVSGNDCNSRNEPGDEDPDDRLTSNAISRLLVELGVDRNDILLEEQSRNTYENARLAKKLIDENHFEDIVLVTDASHMWRSELCCQKFGLKVTPAACNYQAQALEFNPKTILPSDLGVQQARHGIREYIGLLWYWLNGRI